MEGLGIFFTFAIIVAGIILLFLLILLPLYVFQICGAAQRSERILKDILYELQKTNEHLLPPPPQ